MDAADTRLLRAMGLVPFANGPRTLTSLSISSLARAAGLSRRAAAGRVRAFEKSGAIAGYQAYPNLRLLRLEWKSFHFRPAVRAKARVLEAIQEVEGVVGIQEFVGPDMCVDLCYRDDAELARRLRLLERVAGGGPPIGWFDYRMPDVRIAPTALDWRIIRELRNRSDHGAAAVARSLRLTPRTVQRRLDRLLRYGAVDIIPMVNFSAIPQVTPFALLFHLESGKGHGVRNAILGALSDRYLWSWTPPTGDLANFAVVLSVQRTADIEATRRRLGELPAVESVDALVLGDGREMGSWLDEAIGRAADRSGASDADVLPVQKRRRRA